MFASLSRGSSRVRQAYICSSCLSNALLHAPPAPLLIADRGRRAVFFSTSTDAQPNNETNEPVETPENGTPKDGNTVDVADGTERKKGKIERKSKERRLSSSSKALRALRASLALAAQQDAAIIKNERGAQLKPTRSGALRIQRGGRRQELAESKKRKKGAETDGNDAANISTRPSTQSLDEEPVISPPQKKLDLGRLDKAEKRGDSHEAKKDTVTASKTKNSTSKGTKITKKIDETKPAKAPPLVRRTTFRSESESPLVRRIEASSREQQTDQDSIISSADAIESRDMVMMSSNPYTAAIPEFMKNHPAIWEKVLEYRKQKKSLSARMSFRRIFIELIQTGLLSRDQKQVTMRLLRTSVVKRRDPERSSATRSLKPMSTLAMVENGLPAAAGPESTRSVAAPPAGTSRGRKPNPAIAKERARPGPISAQRGTTKHEIKTIEASELRLIPIDKEPIEVPSLAYGLERVLFNPGVYHLQDPRSRVFNFDPYLQTIMPVSEFDFNALKKYITSSRDTTLLTKAKEEEKKYTGSTSSMTSALGHFHFLLSQWRPINTGILSQMFPVEFNSFTALQRGPVAVFLRYRDGTYAIDADKEYDDSNILMMLGKSMEKLLTLSTDDFEKYRKANSDQISEEQRNESEPFHYTTMGDFLLRSQLDAHDPRLPGTGMFDLKTRAVISVRMDTSAFEEGSGYQIRGRHGEWESFEREYYDMIRSAFLKYSLQVRMGRMDGIFVAFHNTERIFGFQYISLPEMDYALHGSDNTAIGDSEFKLSLELLNRVLDRATAKFPKQSIRLHFETRDGVTPFMYIFAEPVTEKKIESIQATNKRKIEEFEREVLGVTTSKLTEEQKEVEWARLRAKVEEEMQNDELGLEIPPEAKTQAELDELVIQEQIKADEILASTAIEEDEDEEDVIIEELDDDSESLEEKEGEDEENLENEENDEESEETLLQDEEVNLKENALDEHDTAEEHVSDGLQEVENSDSFEEEDFDDEDTEQNLLDDLENIEEAESSKEQNLDQQTSAEETLRDHLEEMEEQNLDDQAWTRKHSTEDLGEAEESKSLQEQDLDRQATAEEIVAEDREEADRLEESTEEEETSANESHEETRADENEPNMKTAIARLTAEGILNGPTVKKAVLEEASKRQSIAQAMFEVRERKGAEKKATEATEPKSELKPLLAMTLVIRNKVNGEYVVRPEELDGHDKWEVEYALSEVPKLESAHRLYKMTKERRFRALTRSVDLSAKNAWNNTFIASIKKMSEKGREWREKQDKIEKQLPVKRLEIKEGKTMSAKDQGLWGQGKEE
ncbi:Pet127-domain-containing protein [Stipitochalara longipes BDJ]|nr:Pet127-domain-containing protein [Stipitochalara longipes BDJ]